MIYVEYFTFPNGDEEADFICSILRKCYDTFYPFKILSGHQFERIDFEPVTILYGGNGSGKSTALNVIAEKLQIQRDAIYNKSNFFPDYVNLCKYKLEARIPTSSRIITSDDVFDYILNIRTLNEGIDQRREDLFREYIDVKHSEYQFKSLDDYERLKRQNKARSKTQSKFVRSELIDNVREYSNGENAYIYLPIRLAMMGLPLDEPENSLSPKRQMELAELFSMQRAFWMSVHLSTHSSFLLAIERENMTWTRIL